MLTVSDTGMGIPPDMLNVIFEPYFTTKGRGQGTGMGLAVVQGIVLSYAGRITITARTSSVEALELFRAGPDDFDQVITDMTMPKLTGDRLAVELMKIRPDIPVILCTGYNNSINPETVSKIGVSALSYKPISKRELAKTVRSVLNDYHTQNIKFMHSSIRGKMPH